MQQLTIFDFLSPDPEELLEIKDENVPRIVEYISRETGLKFEINKKRAEYIAQEKDTIYSIDAKIRHFDTYDSSNGKPYISAASYSNTRWNKSKSYFSWTSGASAGYESIKDVMNFFRREKAKANNKARGQK